MAKQKKSNRPILLAVAAVLALILIVGIVVAVILGQKGEKKANPAGETGNPTQVTTEPSHTLPQGTTEPAHTLPEQTQLDPTIPEKAVSIETPYGTLYYPGEWESYLTWENTKTAPYTVRFSTRLDDGRVVELFEVSFGGDTENAIGMLRGEDGQTVAVNVEVFSFKPDAQWNSRDINIVHAMQEAVNDVLAALPLEPVPQQPKPTEPTEPVQTDYMGIDTDYCELKYPVAWADSLYIKQDHTSVAFYSRIDGHEKQLLFTIWFGGTEGTAVTTLTDYQGKPVEVRVTIQEFVPDETWSQEDIRIVYAMQEDLNYLLQNLK